MSSDCGTYGFLNYFEEFGLVYWGLTPQQHEVRVYRGSYQNVCSDCTVYGFQIYGLKRSEDMIYLSGNVSRPIGPISDGSRGWGQGV